MDGGISALAACNKRLKRLVGSRGVAAVPNQPALMFLLSVWFGLLTGLAEVLILAVLQFLLHRYVWYLGLHVLWQIPLADLLIFASLGSVAAVVAWRLPSLVPLWLVTFVYAFVGCAFLLFVVPSLDRRAALVLAAGLAVQVSAFIGAHRDGLYAFLGNPFGALWAHGRGGRPVETPPSSPSGDSSLSISRRQFLVGTGSGVMTVAGMAAGTQGWRVLVKDRALAKLPSAPNQAPNVLFIVLDTVRAANVSMYGYHRRTTPQLERLATSGVRFEQAISTAPWTLPSHASMFTGRYDHELSVGWTSPLDNTYPTLAEAFSSWGYRTAGFVANTLYLSRESGIDRGFEHYEAVPLFPGVLLDASSLGRIVEDSPRLRRLIGYYDLPGRKSGATIDSGFLSWLSGSDPQRPFFVFLNYFDAHSPYLPPKPFDSRFGPVDPRRDPILSAWRRWTPVEVQVEENAYDGSIAYVDQELGRLLEEMERRHLLDDTLVVVAGDHGEEFYEHKMMSHGRSTYFTAIHVPLVIRFPSRVPSGTIVNAPVTLRDLAATIVDLAHPTGAGPFPGNSLARFWTSPARSDVGAASAMLSELNYDPTPLPSWYPVKSGNVKSLVMQQYHYIRNGDGREELYDVGTDPFESSDLSGAADHSATLARCRDGLQSALTFGHV